MTVIEVPAEARRRVLRVELARATDMFDTPTL
jgi:hypothetical protein